MVNCIIRTYMKTSTNTSKYANNAISHQRHINQCRVIFRYHITACYFNITPGTLVPMSDIFSWKWQMACLEKESMSLEPWIRIRCTWEIITIGEPILALGTKTVLHYIQNGAISSISKWKTMGQNSKLLDLEFFFHRICETDLWVDVNDLLPFLVLL